MRKIYLLFTTLFFLTSWGSAQIENKNLFPSPNAAALGTYGQIPIDLFTGTPDINIPLYTFKSRDLSVPIGLSYHSASIKPSDHASWVGLGWSLQAGGVITRILNDLPDEYIDYHLSPATNRGFFYNYPYLSASNWADPNTGLATDEANIFPDFYCAICTGPYLYTSPSRVDLSPDEFQFNFLGMTGSLIMGQDGNWKLKSKNNLNFVVSTVIGPYTVTEPTSHNGSNIRNCLIEFILTASDGTKYTFGGGNAIEFGRKGVGVGDYTSRDGGTVPSSWYLTQIQSITGDVINLQYTRDGYQILVDSKTFGYLSGCNGCTYYYVGGPGNIDDEVTIIDGVTLSSISGINGTVNFNKSKANILDYTFQSVCLSSFGINPPAFCDWVNTMQPAYAYEEFWTGNTGPNNGPSSTFMKLNQITVNDANSKVLKSFNFSYYENTNNRLFLTSLVEGGTDGTLMSPYLFSYNNIGGLANIPYSTLNIDHWGYYNAVNPLTGLVFPTGSNIPNAYNTTFSNTYTNNRSPVVGPMQYGILSQITYPTGGNTQFVWEPNSYSKYINQDPVNNKPSIVIQDLNNTVTGGGLRIKQIISQANFNAPAMTKSYYYYRDYTNNNYLSSGVLNSSLPLYVTEYSQTGSYLYRKWTSNNILPLHYTNGAPFTYTNVQEVNSDGSYKTFTFSNQDNGYPNTLPSNFFINGYTLFNLKEVNTNSIELERGLLLNESSYGIGSVLLNKKIYQYNNDPNRYNNAIRKIYFSRDFAITGNVLSFDNEGFLNVSSNGPVAYKSDNVFPLYTYIHYPYLQSVTETQYDQNGTNPVIMNHSYTYDGYRNKKTEASTASTNVQITSAYNYAADAISGLSTAATAGKTAMTNASMYGIPLEKTVTKGTTQQLHTRMDYQTYTNTNSLLVPFNSYSAVNNNALESETQYTNFDSYGNILQYIPRNGVTTSFQWGYNQIYPTVKIINAANSVDNYTVPQQTTANNGFSWYPVSSSQQSLTFTQAVTGNAVLQFTLYGTSSSVASTLTYSLTGPSNQSGHLCASINNSSCAYPSSITFTNLPAGNYTLTATVTATASIAAGITITYQTIVHNPTTTGIQEFFYDGFEENASLSVATGASHTGNKYWNSGAYTTTFTPPNSRNYTLQYWSFYSGSWVFHQQPYTGITTLTGPVDDVRIFPSDAQMTTYTYTPLVGITSETDPNGKSTIYQYDVFNRLQTIRDQYNNILKQFDYEYQVLSQPVCNSIQSGTFTKSNCPSGYSGLPVTYTVPAGKYCSVISGGANQQALNDVSTNGQAYANSQPTGTACQIAQPTMTGQTGFSLGSPNGNGIISGIPGSTVKVTISAGGSTVNGYTISATVFSGSQTLGSGSVTSSSYTFSFVMPTSGSASWTATFTAVNSTGSGTIYVSY